MPTTLPRLSRLSAPSDVNARAHRQMGALVKRVRLGAIGLAILLAGCQSGPTPLPLAGNPFAPVEPQRPSVGDTYVYHYSDGYGNLPSGKISYRVDQVGADRIVMSVTPDIPREGYARTEVYTKEGNWIRHPLLSHNQPLDREYTTPYPAYVFPLAPGKKWSMRVVAVSPVNPQRREKVRVDGRVVGAQRIRVPAGEFDTIKVRRHVYIDDVGGFMHTIHPTHVSETDWYAPELGRVVRTERDSTWRVSGQFETRVLGDWHVYELASLPAPAR